MKRKIIIISPVYFDIPSYSKLREKIFDIFKDSSDELMFILVDDSAGKDGEVEQMRGFSDVEVISPPFNLGHQRALIFALRKKIKMFNPEDIIVTMDSDGEDSPEDVPRLIENLVSYKGFTLARRTKRQESPLFKLLYFNFKIVFYLLTGTLIKSGNFIAYRVKSIKSIINHPFFNLCYSSVFLGLKLNISNVPCERGKRYFGESKMNAVGLVSHGIRMLMPFLDKIAIRSLILFTMIFLLTISATVVVASFYVFTNVTIPDWVMFSLITSFVVSTLSLGNFIILFAIYSQSMRDAFNFIDYGSSEKKDGLSKVA